MVGLKLHDIFSIPTTFPTQWTMNNEQWKLLTDIQVKCKLYKVYIYIYLVGIYGLRMRDILSIHPKECSSFPNRYTLRLQRTCHCYTRTPSDITFLLSVDKFEFKSKHFHLCSLGNGHTHTAMRASAIIVKFSHLSSFDLAITNASVCLAVWIVQWTLKNDVYTFWYYTDDIIAISNIKSSQKYVSFASFSCLPIVISNTQIETNAYTVHTPHTTHIHSGQTTILCLDGT